MIECVNELHEVKEALAQEIGDRDERNRELMETGQKLSATRGILTGAREVLAVAEKATEETAARNWYVPGKLMRNSGMILRRASG